MFALIWSLICIVGIAILIIAGICLIIRAIIWLFFN